MRTVRTPTYDDVVAARAIVQAYVRSTPVVESDGFDAATALKVETVLPTGSFKVRGALVAVARAAAEQPGTPVVTASAGNHGLGVAYAASVFGVRATIVVPTTVSSAKRATLARFDIDLVAVGDQYDDAEAHALELAARGAWYISPYNDPDTIAGQGSITFELLEQLPDLRTIVVPIGGGGLVSGVALAASRHPDVEVVGVEADASPALSAAIDGRGPVDVRPTLADGLAGNLEAGTVTVDLVRRYVDRIVTVGEGDIADAIRFLAFEHGVIVEGSGAVGVAALRTHAVEPAGRTAVLLTGRNIAHDVLARILA